MSSPTPDRLVRALLTMIAVMFGIIIGLVAGFLHKVDGGSTPSAIQYGCGAFAGGVLFILTLIAFWTGSHNRG